MAKDITIYAVKRLRNWWEVTAGLGPKLLQFLIKKARDEDPCPFTSYTTPFWGPAIMDYWAVNTIRSKMDLADVFVSLLLQKTQPKLVISASEKV